MALDGEGAPEDLELHPAYAHWLLFILQNASVTWKCLDISGLDLAWDALAQHCAGDITKLEDICWDYNSARSGDLTRIIKGSTGLRSLNVRTKYLVHPLLPSGARLDLLTSLDLQLNIAVMIDIMVQRHNVEQCNLTVDRKYWSDPAHPALVKPVRSGAAPITLHKLRSPWIKFNKQLPECVHPSQVCS